MLEPVRGVNGAGARLGQLLDARVAGRAEQAREALACDQASTQVSPASGRNDQGGHRAEEPALVDVPVQMP